MATNDITGDALRSKPTTDAYRDNWDAIFARKKLDYMIDEADGEEPQTCKYCGITAVDVCEYLPPGLCEMAVNTVYYKE